MKKLLIPIIITIIIIICIITAMIFINTDKSYQIEKSTYDQRIEEVEKNTESEQEKKEVIYNVQECVSSYLNAINKNSSAYYATNDKGKLEKVINEDEIILNILSKEYVDKNKITLKNIGNYIQKLETNVFFIPLQSNYIKNGYIYKYAVSGYITDFDYNVIKDIALIVNLDTDNYTYSIEPINIEVNNIDDIELGKTLQTIEKNDYNIFKYISTNAEDDCKRFLDNYKKIALSKPEEAYNKLNEEYKKTRFGSFEAYKQYLEENRDDLKVTQLTQYMVNNKEGKNQYICKDKYGRIYVFEGDNLLKLSIQLDTYTIPTEKFKSEYNTNNAQKKVQMNINKFVLMINNQDWEAAYNLLNTEFKNNYFKTIDEFKKYISNNAYKYNEMKVIKFDVIGDVYSISISLTDLTNGNYEDEAKGSGGSGYVYNWDFTMRLKEEDNFEVAFEIKK